MYSTQPCGMERSEVLPGSERFVHGVCPRGDTGGTVPSNAGDEGLQGTNRGWWDTQCRDTQWWDAQCRDTQCSEHHGGR